MKKNIIKKSLFVLTIALSLSTKVYAEEIVVNKDDNSTYIPTNIINGDFEECPWVPFKLNGTTYTREILNSGKSFLGGTYVEIIYNGTNEGWNTTSDRIYDDGKLFDWTKRTNNILASHAIDATYNEYLQNAPSYSFIEMNGFEASVFFQDLNTIGGDVIRWTLNHGIRPTDIAPLQQNISVEIGAPNKNNGKIVLAHGTGDDLFTEIEPSSSAKYTKDGVTNGSLNSGYANNDELKYLSLSKTTQNQTWYDARGVYVIPNDQTVTRFAFISDVNNADGNLLDDITFSTLIGNLTATLNEDKTVTVSGYWGETDPSKHLIIKIGETEHKLDMSSISGNFTFDISEELIGEETYIEVYHEDYESAKRIVKIVAGTVSRKVESSNNEKISIISSDETIISSLDNVSKNKVKHGENVEIWLEINDINATIEEELKEKINAILENNTLGTIYDISIYKKLESDSEKIKIETTNEKIDFLMDLPEELINKDKNIKREYKIIRIHDGEASYIDSDYNKDNNTIKFSSDKFSEYAIVYNDTNMKNPATGDKITTYLIIGLISIIALITTIILLKKNKRN